MSSSTPTNDHPHSREELLPGFVRKPLQAGAFWMAVFLPFVVLGVLASGIHGMGEVLVFVALVALNLLAFVVGHEYRR